MFEDDINYLPWDSLWDYLLDDEDLDSIPPNGDEQRWSSRYRNDDILDDRLIKLPRASSTKRNDLDSKRWNSDYLRNKDGQMGTRSVHSMTSEKTPLQSNSRYESRNDQSFGDERNTGIDRFRSRCEKIAGRMGSFDHFGKIATEGNEERSITMGNGAVVNEGLFPLENWIAPWIVNSLPETIIHHDSIDDIDKINDDEGSSHFPTNGDHRGAHDAPSDGDAILLLEKKSIQYKEPIETVPLQHTIHERFTSEDPFIPKYSPNDGHDCSQNYKAEKSKLSKEMIASDALKTSFKQVSFGGAYSLATQSQNGADTESIQTNALDSLRSTEEDLERKAAQFSGSLSHNTAVRRVACCSIKNLSEFEQVLMMETGVPFHQLSHEEIIKIFPKLLAVSDNRTGVIGRSNEFRNSLPAHLQSSLMIQGEPQSIYEYNYESEEHRFVSYKSFGTFPHSLMYVGSGRLGRPPAIGTSDVLIQVEVRTLLDRIETTCQALTIFLRFQASTVSRTDCFIRQGLRCRSDSVPLPNTPGVDVIGKICRIDKRSSRRYKLAVGDRVMSLIKWGGNSRYLQIDPARVVRVPETIDPASAVCLVETYLSAYQVLFHGILGARRQRKGSLRGRTYMLFGLDHKFACAISEIARYAGVKTIYASSNKKNLKQLQSQGIVPFNQDTTNWMKLIKGKIDRIVSFEQKVSQLQCDLLNKEGDIILVCGEELKVNESHGPPQLQPNIFCSKATSQRRGKTYNYDVFKEWEERIDQCKIDLTFLVDLLGKEDNISPCVLDRISLHQVAKAHEMLERKRLSGHLVCEPWLVAKSRALRL